VGFMDKVKSTAQQVGDKAQEVGKVGQEKIEDARAKKKIEGLERELGALVYAQRSGTADEGSDAEVDRIVGEITTLRSQLDEGDGGADADSDEASSDEASSDEAGTD